MSKRLTVDDMKKEAYDNVNEYLPLFLEGKIGRNIMDEILLYSLDIFKAAIHIVEWEKKTGLKFK